MLASVFLLDFILEEKEPWENYYILYINFSVKPPLLLYIVLLDLLCYILVNYLDNALVINLL